MTMIWDAPLVAAMASELDQALRGERLRALYLDHAGSGAQLWFRDATLAMRLAPDEGYITLGEPAEPLDESRSLAARVEGVEAPPDDRLMVIHTKRLRGRRESVLVIVELITNHWNVIVTSGEDHRIRHVLRERGGERPLRPGSAWRPPPPAQREGQAGDLPRTRWHEILEVEPRRRRRALLSSVAWTSALNAGPLLGEGFGPDAEASTETSLDRGYDLWREVVGSVSRPQPVVLRLPHGPQPYPLPLPGVEGAAAASLFDAVGRAIHATDSAAPIGLPSSWIAAVEERVREIDSRASALERELENAPDPEETRALGDLLLARFGEVPRGSRTVVLTGFDGENVEIDLDPTLEPHENASRWYDRAARADRARRRLPELLATARADHRAMEELLERVRSGDASADEVRKVLPERHAADPAAVGPRPPYRRFRSSGGLEIRVGRGARHNDDLTFHHSDPNDVWLHARHTSGAHVVLRWKSPENPPARDLQEAATLAALHSGARTSASVPVDWTRRKHVRKPRKSPPGRVLVDQLKTVFVEPNAALIERLKDD